ncbi:MAG: Glutamyl-tRNA reductase [Sodalis sp.]|nr:MAG: Glutamyl-tRNA reductase [Sodalis sp.]
MFQKLFSVAKRVRTEIEISSHAVSVAFAACTIARRNLNPGCGDSAAGGRRRNDLTGGAPPARAQSEAATHGDNLIRLAKINSQLGEADIIITSTASTLPIIAKRMMEQALKQRHYQPMLLVDIAVPHDIDPEVAKRTSAFCIRWTICRPLSKIWRNVNMLRYCRTIVVQESLDSLVGYAANRQWRRYAITVPRW